tara:strand:+ start:1450 stop:1779 length:330 start_codon:yes stop_codon:yes gene_type:complete
MDNYIVSEGKTKAVLAYATIIGTIIAIFMNMDSQNPYARFHIRQAFGIFVLYFLLGFFVGIFDSWFISGPFFIFIIVLWGFGLVNAFQGVTKPVPLVGEKFQQWFTFIN